MEKEKNRHYYWDTTLKFLIFPVIVGLILLFVQTNRLRSVIQDNKTQIENLNATIHKQNIKIESLEYSVTNVTSNVYSIQGQIQEIQIGDNNRFNRSFNQRQ